MSDLSKILANLPPEKRAQLLAKLRKGEKENSAVKKVDLLKDFAFRFQSATAFDFHLSEVEIGDPGPDQVQIRAKAAALNFRDVMIASLLYPSSPGVPSNMGSDYSGVILKTGSEVTELKPGDEVISLHPGHMEEDNSVRDNCHFTNRFNVHKDCVSPKPKNISFEEAACIPTVFLTSYLGLVEMARIQSGEKLLIHTATGGVGLSAIEIARWKQAEIFASAGTPEKREFLQKMGIQKVSDSRSTEFADQLTAEGISLDVILNTLGGDAMTRGMKLLGPFGRFIHLDKKDIAVDYPLPMGLFINGISFHFLDISLLLREPALMKKALVQLVQLFEDGILHPVQYNAFPVQELKQALSTLSRGTHIGKLVVQY